jgi:hypothetical protein
MVADPPRVFYRLVQTNPPTLRDFMSYEAVGIRPRRPLTARQREQWRGVSHYGTAAAARARARISPHLGAYIALVQVPGEATVRVEQAGRDPDHYNVWADPLDLLGWVVSVEPVGRVH